MIETVPKPRIQEAIESLMDEAIREGRWEAAVLFSEEGLPMASMGESPLFPQDRLLEFVYSQTQMVQMLVSCRFEPTEILLIASDRLLVFRYFYAFEGRLALVVVADRRKGYRRALNRILRAVKKLEAL